jgi:carboxypeptidase T
VVVRGLKQFEHKDITFPVRLSADMKSGEQLTFLLQVDNGAYTKTDTLRRVFPGTKRTGISDDFSRTTQWSGNWRTTTATFYSAPSSLTDTPDGNYAVNTLYTAELITPFDIPANVAQASIQFWAKWSINPGLDYAQVSVVNDMANWVPRCGRYTTINQHEVNPSEPLYSGVQAQWVEENIDVSDFIGKKLRVQVKLASNGGGWDGFYMDDFRIVYYDPNSRLTKTIDLDAKDFKLTQRPNPAAEQVTIDWSKTTDQLSGKGHLRIFDLLGKAMWNQPVNLDNTITQTIEVASWSTGVYITNLMLPDGRIVAGKVVVQR